MGNSLQDQLLKAGMIDKQKAQEANGQRRKKQKLKNKGASPDTEPGHDAVRAAQAEKIARDRELNRLKQEEVRKKSIAAQIRQLIELHRLPQDEGETRFNFVDGKLVKTLHVTDETASQLGRGWLSIVKLDSGYEVVPAKVADKINERDMTAVITHEQTGEVDDGMDDPYADFKVPDDLIW
ncbi:MAG: DUF2058 domain-containing protein [Gammaproteobacteria bacterium]|nr:DUF2058 domain-containing protein [Gammaproteobacteria bacterium]